MIYLIEGTVKFESTEHRLEEASTGDIIELSLLASSLLLLLLSRQGEVITRDAIFSELFDRFGANSTNNNLNQYILNLRKSFTYLHLETGIIETIPRVGFTIPESISVQTLAPSVTQNDSGKVLHSRVRQPLLLAYIGTVIMALIMLGIYHFLNEKTSISPLSASDIPLRKIENPRAAICSSFHLSTPQVNFPKTRWRDWIS